MIRGRPATVGTTTLRLAALWIALDPGNPTGVHRRSGASRDNRATAMRSSRTRNTPTTPPTRQARRLSGKRNGRQRLDCRRREALAIIEAFDEEHARMTPTMVATRAGLSRTAARRYLLTLRELRYVDTDAKLFWLAPRVLRLGQSYLDSARLPRTVQPFLQRITATVQETALVAILDEHDVVYVARNGVNRAMAVGFVLGSRAPAPLSSAGLVLLAFQAPESIDQWLASYPIKLFTPPTYSTVERLREVLGEIRRNGYVVTDQQLELGVRGVAVPLRDRHGAVVAAISVSMPIGQESASAALQRVLPTLQETASLLRNLV
jgi:IclR family pca regulon transcriptional regulator